MRVFISYRREDTRDFAGRLADRLRQEPGIDAVFIDIEGLSGGADFRRDIQAAIAKSDAILVLMGENWIGQGGDSTRISNADDFIRFEVLEALRSDAQVIPVLCNDVTMPSAASLPPDINRICALNAIRVRHESFNRDANFLFDTILKRKPPGFWDRYWHRHPFQAGTVRCVVGLLVTLIVITLGAVLHQRVTGLALNQSLGGTGPMLALLGAILLAGILLPAMLGPRRPRRR